MPIKVKYLPKQHIEWNAQKLLAEYGGRYGDVVVPPIPVEEILEKHLKLTLEIDNLEARLGHPDILGALWAPEKLRAMGFVEPDELLASMAIEFVAGEIAPIFRVSAKAMQIRLEELKLVQRDDASLFSMEGVA